MLVFQDRYNATATPFDWRFTRTDTDRLLERIAAHEAARLPGYDGCCLNDTAVYFRRRPLT